MRTSVAIITRPYILINGDRKSAQTVRGFSQLKAIAECVNHYDNSVSPSVSLFLKSVRQIRKFCRNGCTRNTPTFYYSISDG